MAWTRHMRPTAQTGSRPDFGACIIIAGRGRPEGERPGGGATAAGGSARAGTGFAAALALSAAAGTSG
eukprot:CAMPEP_0179291168 /NCGR_PEP_ID=MMETSP0797-20121207/42198_1 /TAXON_ID=47934 /ORGANISM="Dinophysis acuminata, Strain DAEP01" /LENGTH=67 /DNA_ID=CAMNT_0021000235 /DNA_START=150 /DNA_END=350 /DNA_ORIENTATION=-